jgi:Skp family chaperone for outer membrane proteins
MREMFVRALAISWLFTAPAGAQEAAKPSPVAPAPKTEPRTPKIAVLDIDKVWNESLLGKGFAAQLEKQRGELQSIGTQKESQLKKMTDEIQAAQEDLEKQQGVLSPDVIEKRQRELTKKKRDAEDFIQDGKQEVARMQQQLQLQQQNMQNEFLAKVQPYVELVTRERGIDILLEKRATYFAASKDFDLSTEVIVKADEGERSKAAKPTAAGSPAAPGSPKAPAPTTPGPKPPGPQPPPSPKP